MKCKVNRTVSDEIG